MFDLKFPTDCILGTKWTGAKARDINGYKLWYSGSNRIRNGVEIMVEKTLVDKVLEVNRKSDRIMSIKVVMGSEVFNVVSEYAPQFGLEEETKRRFWEDLDKVIQSLPQNERLFIGSDFNGHVGARGDGYDRIHGGFGYGMRNNAVTTVLDFVVAYELMIANSHFKKREEHLVTFKSDIASTLIDYFLLRLGDKSICKDCKVLPRDFVGSNYKLLVMDVQIKGWRRKKWSLGDLRVKWWNLTSDNAAKLVDKTRAKGPWDMEGDANKMWEAMADCIRRNGSLCCGSLERGQ